MKRIILLSLLAMLAGCATHTPMPTNYCGPTEKENCRPWTAGERAGATTRGHSNQPEESK